MTIVTAPPNFYGIDLNDDGTLWREPIIAFKIDDETDHANNSAILIGGALELVESTDGGPFVLTPIGDIFTVVGDLFAKSLAEFREKIAQQRAARG
jgi:hypothetical protein